MASYAKNDRRLVISLHDFHPGSFDRVRDQRRVLKDLGVRAVSILAIPQYHGGASLGDSGLATGWLLDRADDGDEVVLHGYYHERREQPDPPENFFWTKLYTANEAEFFDIPLDLACRRMDAGRTMLRKLGFDPRGFIAPAWLMSPSVRRQVFNSGFAYTTTISEVVTGPSSSIRARSLCWSARAPWRRIASLAWNAALWARVRHGRVVRIGLHPADLECPAMRWQILGIVRAALAAGFVPTTYTQLIQTHG